MISCWKVGRKKNFSAASHIYDFCVCLYMWTYVCILARRCLCCSIGGQSSESKNYYCVFLCLVDSYKVELLSPTHNLFWIQFSFWFPTKLERTACLTILPISKGSREILELYLFKVSVTAMARIWTRQVNPKFRVDFYFFPVYVSYMDWGQQACWYVAVNTSKYIAI